MSEAWTIFSCFPPPGGSVDVWPLNRTSNVTYCEQHQRKLWRSVSLTLNSVCNETVTTAQKPVQKEYKSAKRHNWQLKEAKAELEMKVSEKAEMLSFLMHWFILSSCPFNSMQLFAIFPLQTLFWHWAKTSRTMLPTWAAEQITFGGGEGRERQEKISH